MFAFSNNFSTLLLLNPVPAGMPCGRSDKELLNRSDYPQKISFCNSSFFASGDSVLDPRGTHSWNLQSPTSTEGEARSSASKAPAHHYPGEQTSRISYAGTPPVVTTLATADDR